MLLNRRQLLLSAAFSAAVANGGTWLAAQSNLFSFRIDTDVYEDTSKPPIMRTLTLFSNGICYDFDNTENKQITMIDLQRQRVVLIHPAKQIKADIKMAVLEEKLSHARQEMNADQLKMLARSEGVERDGLTGEIILRNSSLEYRCSLQKAENPEVASLYAQFADWSARLNAIMPPHFPPYLRMELNSLIAAENALPKEMQRTVRGKGRERRLTARLIPIWKLNDEDQALILRVGNMLQYRDVGSLEQYQKEAN